MAMELDIYPMNNVPETHSFQSNSACKKCSRIEAFLCKTLFTAF